MNTRTLNISDEDRALLTEEELAGMQEGEDFDEGQEEGDGQDDQGNGDDADKGGQGDDKSASGSNDDATQRQADQGGDDQGQEGQGGDDDDAAGAGRDDGAPAPVSFETVLPDDFDDQVAAIKANKKELAKQFGEGDLDVETYQEKLDAENARERELERLQDRAEYDLRQRRQTWVNVHVAGFMREHPEYKTPVLQGALDLEVRKLQASGNYINDTDPQILIDAHEQIAAQLPGAFGQPAAKPAQQDQKPAAPAKKPTVPTLANVPAANIDQPGAGEFDMLDRLLESDPLKYQNELDKLARTNPAKYEEYLAS